MLGHSSSFIRPLGTKGTAWYPWFMSITAFAPLSAAFVAFSWGEHPPGKTSQTVLRNEGST
jgi:hypothetical protein